MAGDPLHQLIREHVDAIVERFVTGVIARKLPPVHASRAEIVDELRRYLQEIAGMLEGNTSSDVEAAVTTATHHGGQRWHVGYDIRDVIREYDVLRAVIIEVVTSGGGSVEFGELNQLASVLNRGVSDAAAEFAARVRDQVEAAQRETERALQAREEVVEIVSHDLKTPLNVIFGNAELLTRELADPGLEARAPELRKRVAAIHRAAGRMNKLIVDLLDLARLQAGHVEPDGQECDLGRLLRELKDQEQELAEQRSIRLVLEEPPARPVTLACNRERTLQALGNVVGNAFKFSEPGSAVEVLVSCSADECTFVVRDQGRGIPEEQMPLLFDRFWRAPGTGAKGTGLGLAIAKGLVETQGGRIWAESTLGQGSTFFVALPRRA